MHPTHVRRLYMTLRPRITWSLSTSTDQVAATLMQCLGLPATALLDVFPNLVHFAQKSLPVLRA